MWKTESNYYKMVTICRGTVTNRPKRLTIPRFSVILLKNRIKYINMSYYA